MFPVVITSNEVIGNIYKVEAVGVALRRSAAMTTNRTTAAETSASPLMSFQTRAGESERKKVDAPCHQSPVLVVGYHHQTKTKKKPSR